MRFRFTAVASDFGSVPSDVYITEVEADSFEEALIKKWNLTDEEIEGMSDEYVDEDEYEERWKVEPHVSLLDVWAFSDPYGGGGSIMKMG